MRTPGLLLFLVAPAALAQSLPLQDADVLLPDQVITATRVPTLIESIPAGVTVIDRQQIQLRGYTSLPEVLAAVPGLRIYQSGNMGGNASVFMRGTNSNHVLVLRDGVPVNDPSDPGGGFNFGVDALDAVERIEVVRGPMSSLYGSGAIGGVINIITKHGTATPVRELDFGYGLPRTTRLAATIAGQEGKFDYAIRLADRADRGFDNTPSRESVYTTARNGFTSRNASIEVGYTPVDGVRVFGQMQGRQSYFALDQLGFPAYDANYYRGHDNLISGRGGVTARMFEGKLDTSLVVSRMVTDRHYTEPLEAADPNQAQSDTKYHGGRTAVVNENTWHFGANDWSRDTAVLFGGQYLYDTSRSSLNASYFGFPYLSNVNASEASYAGHVGAQTTLLDRLTLTADMRGDQSGYGGGAVTWRTGFVLAVPEVWGRVKGSYGTAFRAPSLFDLFGVDSSGYVGNPNLKSERSQGWETGFAIDIPALGRKNAATVEVTWFGNKIRDLIQLVYNSTYTASTPENVSRATTSGYEAALTLRPIDAVELRSAYTLTNTRNDETGQQLLRRPRQMASFSAAITPIPGLRLAPELTYTGPFQDFLVDNNGFPGGIGATRPGWVLNATASYDITPRLTGYLNGYNLTGSKFEPASGYQMPGATLVAGLRARF